MNRFILGSNNQREILMRMEGKSLECDWYERILVVLLRCDVTIFLRWRSLACQTLTILLPNVLPEEVIEKEK